MARVCWETSIPASTRNNRRLIFIDNLSGVLSNSIISRREHRYLCQAAVSIPDCHELHRSSAFLVESASLSYYS